jgi:hypothetical protein
MYEAMFSATPHHKKIILDVSLSELGEASR